MFPRRHASNVAHLDADAFFAAVEQAADPRLRGKPVAVGGERRGIIASASYEARRFGIFTPMPTVRARKLCPNLILLPGDFEKYERFSRWMFSYAYDFTPDVEICSIDEGYFDLSGLRKDPVEVAGTIRNAIRQALKITVSEGIGANKLVSQIASKLHKPAAFEYVPSGQETLFLHPLPNRWLPGVGPKTAARLDAAGLARIRQIAATPVELLNLLVGNAAPRLREFANGIDERPVVPVSQPAKSYGRQETFGQDQTDEVYLSAVLRRMADHLFAKARADGKSVRTLTVKVRYNDMAEDQVSESLAEPTDLETDVYTRLTSLLKRAWRRRVSLRLIALRLTNLYEGLFREELALSRAAQQQGARRRLADVVDQLRYDCGRDVVLRGHDLVLREGEPNPTPKVKVVLHVKPVSYRSTGGGIGKPIKRLGDLSPATPGAGTGSRSAPPPARSRGLPRTATRALVPCPLVVRSHYSFLNSTLSIANLIEVARQHELPTVALCDQGNLHGAVEFVAAAKAAGIKPVLGAEVRLADRPLWLYVQNQTGYANLCRLLSPGANREGRTTKTASAPISPASACDLPALRPENPSALEGLLAVSSDPSLAPYFPDRFYRAITDQATLRREDGRDPLPAVPVVPVHYETADDRGKFEIVQSIRTLTLLRQTHPDKLVRGNYHYRSPAELRSLFARHPRLLAHAQEILDRCEFTFVFGKPQFPHFHPPDGSLPREFLRRLVIEGLQRRYPATRLSRFKAQVDEELRIIAEVGYEEYFLIVWDLLRGCRARGIDWITRGSAADSLVCYCLGISDVCPIRFDLYFRRFLNQERMALNKLPDIDVDFPHDRKDDVVDLIFEKYGEQRCAVVGGFNTYKARGAVGDVAKVLGVSEYQIRRFTEHFPWSGAKGLRELLRRSPECRDLPLDEEPYKSALDMAECLDGAPRYPKMHPCGVVLSRQPMHELTPTFVSQKGYSTTHLDMDAVEAIGLVKMDILAQGGLAAMRDVQAALRTRGLEVDLTRFTVSQHPQREEAAREPDRRRSAGFIPLQRNGVQGKGPVRTSDRNRKLMRPKVRAPQFMGTEQFKKEQSASPEPSHAGRAGGPLPAAKGLSHSPAGRPTECAPYPRQSLVTTAAASWEFNDPNVWEMIASGNARAVHHIESPAMTSLCRMCNVRDIDTLVAVVSVIRPGAANEDKKREFTRRYQGLSATTYAHPSLESCLRSTFGLVVYEEHILQICDAFAGLPGGRADLLRRALVKEDTDRVATIALEFAACARRRGRSEAEIDRVWQLVTGFHGYAFCKAHSTAYGVEAYQSAWLKRYFPAEFMAAVLTNGKGFYRPLVYVLECWRLGIPLAPPRINRPGPAFVVEHREQSTDTNSASHPTAHERSPRDGLDTSAADPVLRVPVTSIQSLTERTKRRLLDQRTQGEFGSMADFFLRVRPSREEMETLVRAGALDEFGLSRCAQFWECQQLFARWGDGATTGQGWLIPPPEIVGSTAARRLRETTASASASADANRPESDVDFHPFDSTFLTEPARAQRLQWETELIGFPASGHPLELYPDIAWDTYCPVNRLPEFVGQEVTLCGLVVEDRLHRQESGEPMKFLTLADWTGMIETELFAKTYKSYALTTVRYPVLEVTGRVESFENGCGHTLRVLRAGKPRPKR